MRYKNIRVFLFTLPIVCFVALPLNVAAQGVVSNKKVDTNLLDTQKDGAITDINFDNKDLNIRPVDNDDGVSKQKIDSIKKENEKKYYKIAKEQNRSAERAIESAKNIALYIDKEIKRLVGEFTNEMKILSKKIILEERAGGDANTLKVLSVKLEYLTLSYRIAINELNAVREGAIDGFLKYAKEKEG